MLKKESDYPDFLSGSERENAQHITVRYLTDEKPKSDPKSKDKKTNDGDNVKPLEDTRGDELLSCAVSPQSEHKSSRGLFSSRTSKTLNSSRTKAKPNDSHALSVTARWRLPVQSLSASTASRRVTFNFDASPSPEVGYSNGDTSGYTSADDAALNDSNVDETRQSRPKKKGIDRRLQSSKQGRNKLLGSSLDAGILREALDTDNGNTNELDPVFHDRNVQLNLSNSLEEADEETSDSHVVPPLDLQDLNGTPRSILR